MKALFRIFTFAKGLPLFLFFLIISVWLLTQRTEERLRFHEIMTSTILFPVQKIIHTVSHYSDIKKDNVILRQENARLRWLYDQRAQAEKENRRLRNYFHFEHPDNFPIQLAQVIARDPSRLNSTLVINLGSSDSLVSGMPVYTPKGIVGRVEKVFSSHSTVRLLLDLQSKLSVMENRSRTVGILETSNGEEVEFSFPSHAEVFVGDSLITSGLGGVFPKGLSVGRVETIEESEIGVISNARVQLFQNPRYLEEVFVMKKEPSRILKQVSENE